LIRVLHCVDSMDRGGLETFIMNVYRNIDRSKIQFDFLVRVDGKCSYDDEIISLGGQILYVPAHRKFNKYKNKPALDKFFKENACKYKAVHVHVSHLGNVSVLSKAKKYKIKKRIIHSHSTSIKLKDIFRAVFHGFAHEINKYRVENYATHFFACSKAAGRWLYNNKTFAKHTRVINNAIEAEKFVFDNKIRNDVRKELGIENKFAIGHVGRFAYEKNHDFLIEVFAEVYTRDENACLLLVGKGELEASIAEKAEGLGIKEAVKFLGVREDVNEIMQAMDVFVFPSYYEGLGIVVIEAQASGLPCVISDVVPDEVKITDLVKKVSLSTSVEEWAEEVLKYANIQNRRDTRDEIAAAGYDISSTVEVLSKVYTCGE